MTPRTKRTKYDTESPLATRPILYNDTIKGEEVHRDDLWAVTTSELNQVQGLVEAARYFLEVLDVEVEGPGQKRLRAALAPFSRREGK